MPCVFRYVLGVLLLGLMAVGCSKEVKKDFGSPRSVIPKRSADEQAMKFEAQYKIGVLYEETGYESENGASARKGIEIAVKTANDFFKTQESDFQCVPVWEDTKTDTGVAKLSLARMDQEEGIRVFVVTGEDEEIFALLNYSEPENRDVILMSSGSEAEELGHETAAHATDNLYRTHLSLEHEVRVIEKLLEDRSIKYVLTITRDDVGGSDFEVLFDRESNQVIEHWDLAYHAAEFENFDFHSGESYFSTLLDEADDVLQNWLNEGATHNNIAVLLVAEEAAGALLYEVSDREEEDQGSDFADVRWFATDGLRPDLQQIELDDFGFDPSEQSFFDEAIKFAGEVGLISLRARLELTEAERAEFEAAGVEELGDAVPAYEAFLLPCVAAFDFYEQKLSPTTHAFGLVMGQLGAGQHKYSDSVDFSLSGSVAFDEEGDQSSGTFDIFQVEDGHWVKIDEISSQSVESGLSDEIITGDEEEQPEHD